MHYIHAFCYRGLSLFSLIYILSSASNSLPHLSLCSFSYIFHLSSVKFALCVGLNQKMAEIEKNILLKRVELTGNSKRLEN